MTVVASSSHRSRKGESRSGVGREQDVHFPTAYRQAVVDPGTPYPANQSAPRPAGSLGQVRFFVVEFCVRWEECADERLRCSSSIRRISLLRL